jgi:hypothetical protein
MIIDTNVYFMIHYQIFKDRIDQLSVNRYPVGNDG